MGNQCLFRNSTSNYIHDPSNHQPPVPVDQIPKEEPIAAENRFVKPSTSSDSAKSSLTQTIRNHLKRQKSASSWAASSASPSPSSHHHHHNTNEEAMSNQVVVIKPRPCADSVIYKRVADLCLKRAAVHKDSIAAESVQRVLSKAGEPNSTITPTTVPHVTAHECLTNAQERLMDAIYYLESVKDGTFYHKNYSIARSRSSGNSYNSNSIIHHSPANSQSNANLSRPVSKTDILLGPTSSSHSPCPSSPSSSSPISIPEHHPEPANEDAVIITFSDTAGERMN
jgi:hypothetical protein